MNKKITFKITVAVLVLSLIANGIFASSIVFDLDLPFFNKKLVDEQLYKDYEIFKKNVKLKNEIDKKYYKEVDEEKLVEGSIEGMFYSLDDKYSYYIPEEELKKKQNSEKGISIGIGVSVNILEDGRIKIVSLDEEGTAIKAGLKPNDIITEIDGIKLSLETLYDALGVISKDNRKYIIFGAYPNIELKILRENAELEFDVERKKMVDKAFSQEILDANIGYIKIEQFINDTPDYFREALIEMKNKGVDKLIIDLRGNPGGLLGSVVETTGYLVGQKTIIYTENKNEEKKDYNAKVNQIYDGEVVVLVNEKSASASEAMTSALKDYERAVVVGTNTFGKGIVQTTYTMGDGTGYKLTTNEYFSPKGNSIHKIGVKPDFVINGEEKQLEKALELLKK
ncbi:MAG: S41 family peptidase [Proteocatella sp.]